MARRKLTDQQKARIAKIQEKRRQRAASKAEASLAQNDEADQHTGRVIGVEFNACTASGANNDSIFLLLNIDSGEFDAVAIITASLSPADPDQREITVETYYPAAGEDRILYRRQLELTRPQTEDAP